MSTPRRVTWSGDVPADAEDARERILEAAVRCVSRVGVDRTIGRLLETATMLLEPVHDRQDRLLGSLSHDLLAIREVGIQRRAS